jgi:hypothetical protein
LVVGAALSGQEDYLGADDRIIRCRIFSGHGFQDGPLGVAESNSVLACSWHNIGHVGERSLADCRPEGKLKYVRIVIDMPDFELLEKPHGERSCSAVATPPPVIFDAAQYRTAPVFDRDPPDR